jgi:hypothetical protein
VKEDLFMHSSCIEHFVIRAKLIDLNDLNLLELPSGRHLPSCQYACSSHRNNRDSPGLRSLGAGQEKISQILILGVC